MKYERKVTPVSLRDIACYIEKNADAIGSFGVMVYPKKGCILPGLPGQDETELPSLLMFAHETAESGADLFEQFIDVHIVGMPHIMAIIAERQAKRSMEQQMLLGADGKELERGN